MHCQSYEQLVKLFAYPIVGGWASQNSHRTATKLLSLIHYTCPIYRPRGMALRNITAAIFMCLVNGACETNKLQEGELHNDENFSCIFYQQYFIRRLFVCSGLFRYSLSLHKNDFAAELRLLMAAPLIV